MGKTADSLPKRQSEQSVVEVSEGCPTPPKVDPRVRRTRKLLEDALRQLVHERSFSEISVADIADRATVNRATFYAHFEDKGHLASTMMREDLHNALVERLSPPAAFGPEAVLRVATGMFEFMARTLGGCRKQADECSTAVGNTLQETLEEFFATWLERQPEAMRRFPKASRASVANAFAWAIYGGANRWSRLAHRPDAAIAAEEVVSLLFGSRT